MFRRLTPIAVAAFAAVTTIITSVAAQAQVSDSATVIESGGLSITKSDFERMLANDPRFQKAMVTPGGKQALGEIFGKAFALESEARKRKLDQDPGVQLRIRNFTQQLLAAELVASLRKDYLKDGTKVRAAYEANKDAYAQPRVRQILVRFKGSQVPLRPGQRELSVEQAKAKAESLLARLVTGADFAALAKAESDDTGSRANGGDIGFVPKGSTGAEFETVAFAMPKGELSKVVKTEFGFHILRVEDRQPIGFDAIKASIANDLAHADLDKLILNGYTLNTAYFDSK